MPSEGKAGETARRGPLERTGFVAGDAPADLLHADGRGPDDGTEPVGLDEDRAAVVLLASTVERHPEREGRAVPFAHAC
jgi:hypothetical protein